MLCHHLLEKLYSLCLLLDKSLRSEASRWASRRAGWRFMASSGHMHSRQIEPMQRTM